MCCVVLFCFAWQEWEAWLDARQLVAGPSEGVVVLAAGAEHSAAVTDKGEHSSCRCP